MATMIRGRDEVPTKAVDKSLQLVCDRLDMLANVGTMTLLETVQIDL